MQERDGDANTDAVTMAVGLDSLPLELILMIVACIDQPWDLNALVLTNRHCCHGLRKSLFHRWQKRVLLWAARHGRCDVMEAMLGILSQHHRAGAFLGQELIYNAPLIDEWGYEYEQGARNAVWEYLARFKEDPTQQSTTALHVACAFGCVGMVHYLLDRGVSATTSSSSLCIRARVLETSRALPVFPHANRDGYHPLHTAICFGHESVARLLLERGYSLASKAGSPHGTSAAVLLPWLKHAMSYAALRGLPKLFGHLARWCLDLLRTDCPACVSEPQPEPDPAVISLFSIARAFLCLCGDYGAVIAIVQGLANLGISVDEPLTVPGVPVRPLEYALRVKNFEGARAFLACGACAQCAFGPNSNSTCLLVAIQGEHWPPSGVLSITGWLARMETWFAQRLNYVEDLFARGYRLCEADLVGTRFDYPPLILAAQYGLVDFMKLLLSLTDEIDLDYACGYEEDTALMVAAVSDQAEAVEFVLRAGASIKAADQLGGAAQEYALRFAVSHHPRTMPTEAVLKPLLQHGANAGFRSARGSVVPGPLITSLSRAPWLGHDDLGWLANAIRWRSAIPRAERDRCADLDHLIDVILEHSTGANIARDWWAYIVFLVLLEPALPVNLVAKLASFGTRAGYRLTETALNRYLEAVGSDTPSPPDDLYGLVDALFVHFGDGMRIEVARGNTSSFFTRQHLLAHLLLAQSKIRCPRRGRLSSSLASSLIEKTNEEGEEEDSTQTTQEKRVHLRLLLDLAVGAQDEAVVQLLLRHGSDVNEGGGFESTPLKTAVMFGAPREMVRRLLDRGADPWRASGKRTSEALDSEQRMRSHRTQGVDCLLKVPVGRDIFGLIRTGLDDFKWLAGKSAFEAAFDDHRTDLLEDMLTLGPGRMPAPSAAVFDVLWEPSPFSTDSLDLHDATRLEQTRGPRPKTTKMSVLVWACLGREWGLVPLLLAAGANPDGAAAAEPARPLPLLVSQAATFIRNSVPFDGGAWLAAFCALRDAGADLDAPLVRDGTGTGTGPWSWPWPQLAGKEEGLWQPAWEEDRCLQMAREGGEHDEDDEEKDWVWGAITARSQIIHLMHLMHLKETGSPEGSIFLEKVHEAVFGVKTDQGERKGKET